MNLKFLLGRSQFLCKFLRTYYKKKYNLLIQEIHVYVRVFMFKNIFFIIESLINDINLDKFPNIAKTKQDSIN